MKLHKLKAIIDEAVKRAEHTDPDVEVWYGEEEFGIKSIGQFGLIPDVTICVCPIDELDDEDEEDD